MKQPPPDRRSRLLLTGLCLMALLMPGCRGCDDGLTPQEQAQKEAEEEERKRKEEEEKKKKAPMVVGPLRPLPSQSDQPRLYVKPGHWTVVSQEMKRNYDDWVGEESYESVDARDQPIAVPLTPFTLRSRRPVALSKGQSKDIQAVVFPPPASRKSAVRWDVRGRDTLNVLPGVSEPTLQMQPHQYHFVVLAADPASYGKLGALRSVDSPLHFDVDLQERPDMWPARRQYRVVAPELGDRAPLPDSLFCLTSTAYVLWDEVDPSIFEPAQRQALVDWLHWGGQLIVSGPDSLALLRDSFLSPYLPATGGDAWQVGQADLQPMLDAWGVGRRGPRFEQTRPWSGIRLNLVEDSAERRGSADPVGRATAQLRCGDLFAERRVGRGRVIVSAVQLNQRGLQNWQNGFECLMNAVVLRRPPRKFRGDNASISGAAEFGGAVASESAIAVEWAQGDPVAFDSAYNTSFRMLSRDLYTEQTPWRFHGQAPAEEPGVPGMFNGFGGQFSGSGSGSVLAPPSYPGGAGGWNDFNAVSDAARNSLREAAGVSVPDASFVLACIGLYLLILAPFNWMLFRAVGRVELAWAAAPLIAIAGTVVVVKLAQLDIGFVRAQTQVALLETQPNYPRGCLTRYTGVYTSLGTGYDVTFEDPGAVAAPFSTGPGFKMLSGQQLTEVVYDRQDKARLLGLQVSSSSTGMIHSEEIHDAGGSLRLGTASSGTLQIENQSEHPLRQLAVVYRPVDKPRADGNRPPAELWGCWIGDLAGRDSFPLNWSPITTAEGQAAFAAERAEDADAGQMNLEPLWRLALDPERLEPGEHRAVARIDAPLTGMTVSPAAAQQTSATLWVAHLQYEIPPAPQPDKNAPVDVMRDK